MLSPDVGAAPAAAPAHLQPNSAVPRAGSRRHHGASGSGDAFSELVDRMADDRPAADGPDRRVAQNTLRGQQKPETPATAVAAADDTADPVPTKPRHRSADRADAEPSKTDRADNDSDNGVVIDPRLMAAIPTIQVPLRPDGHGGERAAIGTPSPVMQPLAPKPFVLPTNPASEGPHLPQTGVVSAAAADEMTAIAVPEPENGSATAASAADQGCASEESAPVLQEAGTQVVSADAGPLIASLSVGTGAAHVNGSQETGMTARQVALSALRAAIAREPAQADRADDVSAIADADPGAEAQTVSPPAAAIIAQPADVPSASPQARAAAPAAATPGPTRAAERSSPRSGMPETAANDAGTAAAADAPPGTPATGETAAAEVPTTTESKPSTGSADNIRQTAPPNAGSTGEVDGPRAATAGVPVRKEASHEPVPNPAPRPSARVTHAIAAFHAAATVGAPGTPASFRAQIAEAASTASTLLDRELPAQFVQAIRVQFDNGGGEARVRLNPGFLGGVTVGVQVDGTSVVASLQAGSADVREWLQRNEQTLRQSLADQGLHLERLVIVDEEAQSSRDDERRGGQREEQQEQSSRRPRRPDEHGTFELVL